MSRSPAHRTTDDLIKRLWAGTRIDLITHCYLWTKGKNKGGYGTISFRGKDRRVTKVIAWLCLGVPLESSSIEMRHVRRCNVACWNPTHIKPGSHRDNMRDAIEDGTHNFRGTK